MENVNVGEKESNQFPSLGFEHMWQQPTNWKAEVRVERCKKFVRHIFVVRIHDRLLAQLVNHEHEKKLGKKKMLLSCRYVISYNNYAV